jgi:hypothetical protein
MKFKTSTLFWTFIWCIFMGITVGSIGIGAVFPAANLIAKPFVCPGGEMQNVSQYYQVSPVESVTTLTWYCIDPRGNKTELGIFPMSLYAGTIYGLLLFVAVFVGMTVMTNRRESSPQKVGSRTGNVDMARLNALLEQTGKLRGSLAADQEKAERMAGKTQAATTALTRMKELKELRAANEISEAEYEKKRAEILKDL